MAVKNLKDAIRERTTPAKGIAYALGTPAQELQPETVRTDGGTQARAELNAATVEEYAQAMQDGATFPPIVVYYDGSDYWLADGFHRVAAARSAGRAVVADVRPGTRRDAILWAVGANDTHGLRRTREDVRRSIETLLRDVEWGQWSDREIARQVHCHHNTVATVREKLSGEISQMETRTVARNGTTYQQKRREPPTEPPASKSTAPPTPNAPEPPSHKAKFVNLTNSPEESAESTAAHGPTAPAHKVWRDALSQFRGAKAQARAVQLQAKHFVGQQRRTLLEEIESLQRGLEAAQKALEASL